MPKYHVIVPHLEVEVFEVEALDPDDAIRVWRDAEAVLEPVNAFTPVPGPQVRAELAEPDPVVGDGALEDMAQEVTSDVLQGSSEMKCGKCSSLNVKTGRTDNGVEALICQACGAVGLALKLG